MIRLYSLLFSTLLMLFAHSSQAVNSNEEVFDDYEYGFYVKQFTQTRSERLDFYTPGAWPAGTGTVAGDVLAKLNSAIAYTYLGRSYELAISSEELDEHLFNLFWPLPTRLLLSSWDKAELYPNQLKNQDQELLLNYFWRQFETRFTENEGQPANTPADTWRWANDSENHLFTKQSTYLLVSQILKEVSPYNTYTIDGKNAEQIYQEWRTHWHHRLDEYLKGGLIIEAAAAGYLKYTYASILNIADFSADAELSLKARTLIDMILANAAIESLPNHARGGSKSRKGSLSGIEQDSTVTLARTYLTNNVLGDIFGAVVSTSGYYPSEAIINLWLNASQSKHYEVYGARPGVLHTNTLDVDADNSVLRYSYVTPDYVMGSAMIEAGKREYAEVTAEARYLSLVGRPSTEHASDLLSTPITVFGGGGYLCMDKIIAVQDRSVLVFQNNIDFYRNGKKPCWGTPNAQSSTQFSRRLDDGSTVTYLRSDDELFNWEKYDPNRNHVDIAVTHDVNNEGDKKDIKVSQEGEFTFLEYPDGNTFVSIQAINKIPECEQENPFDVRVGGYNPDPYNQTIDSGYGMQDIVLNCDKFAPIAVEVGRKKHYQNFNIFKTDMKAKHNRFDEIKTPTASGTVSSYFYQASIRSSLNLNDRFLDNSSIIDYPASTEPVVVTSNQSGNSNNSQWPFENNYYDFQHGDYIEYEFDIAEAGNYHLFGRFISPDGGRNSVYISFNGGGQKAWHLDKRSTWDWQDFKVDNAQQSFYLPKGSNRVRVSTREVGTLFDALILSQASELPEPANVELVEFVNGSEPYSKQNKVDINRIPEFTQAHLSSPYLQSDKEGTWSIRGKQYGTVSFFREQQFYRYDGYFVEAEEMDLVSGGKETQSNDILQSEVLYLKDRGTLEHRFEDIAPGNYRLVLHTKTGENPELKPGNQDSFYVALGSTENVVTTSSSWTWSLAHDATDPQRKELLHKHLGGDLTVSIRERESYSLIDAILLVPEPSTLDLMRHAYDKPDCWLLYNDQLDVQSCGPSNAHWDLNLNHSSLYELSGITEAQNGSDNSFWVASAGVNHKTWSFNWGAPNWGAPEWTSFNNNDPVNEPEELLIDKDDAWLELRKRENNAVISQLKLTKKHLNTFVFNSENFSSNTGFEILGDPSSMSKNILKSVTGKSVRFDFEISQPAYYCLNARTLAMNGNTDSLFYSFNGEEQETWQTGAYSSYLSERVHNRVSDDTEEMACRYFDKGSNQLLIKGRENGLQIDYLYLHQI